MKKSRFRANKKSVPAIFTGTDFVLTGTRFSTFRPCLRQRLVLLVLALLGCL